MLTLENYAIVRAMKIVLMQPIKRFSIVQLAQEAKLAPSAAKYAFDYMLEKGLVRDEKIGNTHQYRADTESYLTRQWKILFSLEEITKAKVVQRILATRKSVLSIVVYGSVAVGKDDENSDIDILVIADTNWEGKKAIMACARETYREPNINVYTPMEWRKKAAIHKVFYENVIVDSIVLYGQKPVVL